MSKGIPICKLVYCTIHIHWNIHINIIKVSIWDRSIDDGFLRKPRKMYNWTELNMKITFFNWIRWKWWNTITIIKTTLSLNSLTLLREPNVKSKYVFKIKIKPKY